MTKTELIGLLRELDVRPNRRLGQNFLVDANLLAAIVRDAAPRPGERVLEIGPGPGQLTRCLLEAGCRVTAVEVDDHLAAYLAAEFGTHARFRLVRGDACKLDLGTLMGPDPYRVIANLPYSCSSVLLAQLSALPEPPTELFVLLQQEMAARLTAAPGCKAYGSLTIAVQTAYAVRQRRPVPASVFYPEPEVASAAAQLQQQNPLAPAALRATAVRIARAGFAQRRKKMFGRLAAVWNADTVRAAYAELGLDSKLRAEELPVTGYLALARRLTQSEACP